MAQTISNNNVQILKLQEEIKILRSFIIGILGRDKEGKYNSEFVKKVLKSSQEKPKYIFKGKDSFLKQIHKN